MARILTGIQSSGKPHLGNIVGAMLPALKLAQNPVDEQFLFIADLHSLTTIKDPVQRKNNVHIIAAAWLACGLDPNKVTFYRQSKIPEVCELAWLLNCFTPYPMLANAHSFKEKSNRLADVNLGLFTYPVLMAADILLYKADCVPVNKDQLQHVEIARDIAGKFNAIYPNTFTMPQAKVNAIQLVPGIDGQKMSKSYQNTIDIFLPEKELQKNIMAIQTDSRPLAAPKDPNSCIVFQLYSLLADTSQTHTLQKRYITGGYGYGHAKKELFGLILELFESERKLFNSYMKNISVLNIILEKGEAKGCRVAQKTLNVVRSQLGF